MKDTLQFKIACKMQQKYDTLKKYPTKDVCFMLFKNFQISQTTATGLRLTKLGNSLLKTEYDHYKFPTEEGLHKNLLLTLHSNMKWPYFLEKKELIVYSEDDALWLKMFGSVEKFAKGLE